MGHKLSLLLLALTVLFCPSALAQEEITLNVDDASHITVTVADREVKVSNGDNNALRSLPKGIYIVNGKKLCR